MKIEFDKALLWLLPYLYLVSVAYYWGYWGAFDVDIFNYYPVSDLIKGVTAPLGGSLLLVTGFGFVMVLIRKQFNNFETVTNKLLFMLIITSTVSIACILIYLRINPSPISKIDGLKTKAIVCSSIAVFLTAFINSRMPKMSGFNEAIRSSVILFVVLLPFQAYLDGKHKAIRVQIGQEFDYVVTDSITKSQDIYKYLGKAGEYQILLSQNNSKRIIVSAGKLDPLVIEKFIWKDSASIQRFKAYQKKLPATTTSK